MADATTAMTTARVDALAVVDDDGRSIGMVSLADVLRATGLLRHPPQPDE
jgi:CBS domain-containing protein